MTTRRVVLEGGAPWGFRMHGGNDHSQLLRISRVNPGSKASLRGVREGDLISSINGRNTRDLTNAESHGLLKQAGDCLILGLNEESGDSPKRRQYKTVHQETHEETVKKSTFSTYSSKKTLERVVSQTKKDNENGLTNHNEKAKVNGTSKDNTTAKHPVLSQKSSLPSLISSSTSSSTLVKEADQKYTSLDNAEASQRSSYTNCTLSPSSSVFSEDGHCSCTTTSYLDVPPVDDMNDNGASRSKKRRQRKRNRKQYGNNTQNTSNHCDTVNDEDLEHQNDPEKEEYTVHSPAELVKGAKRKKKPVKSRSLDDDEMVNIQEISEVSEVEDRDNQTAIVSEASESEVDWEETTDFDTPGPLHGTLSTITLPLEGYSTEQVTLISPEEEKTLRNFLEGLNLVNGPDESAKFVYEKNTLESIRERKAKKRAALEQYFLPFSQNPRYLDVISEETSDKDSDKEQSGSKHHLKQGTPELDIPPKIPPRPNRDRRRTLPKHLPPIEQPGPFLVDAKIVDNPSISEGFCSTTKTEEASNVEIVFLGDSSGSDSPEDGDTTSVESCQIDDTSNLSDETERTEYWPVTHKQDNLVTRSSTYEEMSGKNETLSTSSSTNYSFSIKADRPFNDRYQGVIDNGLLSQLTPPPTPDNMSPKETACSYQTLTGKNEQELDTQIVHTDVVSPPPPSRSSSSSRSSSRESSQCTVTYIPSTSSITDVTTLATEEESATLKFQPLTLREICLKLLLALPFGNEVLQELAEVSMRIQSFTNSLPSAVLPKIVPNLAQFENNPKQDLNNISSNLSVQKLPKQVLRTGATTKEFVIPIRREKECEVSRGLTEKKNLELLCTKPEVSIKEREIVREQEDLRKTLETIHIPVERNIPVKKDWDGGVAPSSRKEEISRGMQENQGKPVCTSERNIPVTKDWEEVTVPVIELKENSSTLTRERIIPITIKNQSVQPSVWGEMKIPITNEWVGLPSENNPTLLACLSPKQKEELEKTKRIPDEAQKLIELHEKFVNRRTHEERRKIDEEKVTITSFSKNIIDASPSNRMLTIIKEEPLIGYDDHNFLYFVEKTPRPSFTLPRSISSDNPRLRARDLGEWLELARNKSMSESNLNVAPDIPENNLRNIFNPPPPATMQRRTSLPQEMYEKQMLYIQEKEREIQRQLEALEEERRELNAEMAPSKQFHAEDYYFSRQGDYAENKKRPVSMPLIPTEFFRQQMYEEYMDKFAEREERKQHKVIKVTSSKDGNQDSATANAKEIIHPIQLEDEFMDKVKKKQEEGKLEKVKSVDKESSVENVNDEGAPVLVMDGEKLKEATKLPKHLQEFVDITKQIAEDEDGIWSPGLKQDLRESDLRNQQEQRTPQDESLAPVWTPKSATSSPTVERKEFRPVSFQSPVLSRKSRTKSENLGPDSPSAPPWKIPDYSSDSGLASSFLEKRLPTSRSSPASGFGDFSSSPRLPKAQNPTITLLQKAREGHLPRGPTYIEQEQRHFRLRKDRPPIANPGEVLYQVKNEYTSESDSERPRKMADLGPRKFEGIGPVTKDGMPLILRSEIKDQNQSKWYKRMYDTIHKTKPHSDEFVTVRYKQKRAQYPYSSGYLSEPEPGAYDSDFTEYRYQTLDRRRPTMQDYTSARTVSTVPRNVTNRSASDILQETRDYYKTQPGRIENYTPGHSSISDKEAKQWWDEVMDIFDGHLEQQKRVPPSHPKSFINQALKESGYESDSTLVFRRREDTASQLSPKEQKEAYKVIQKGGDVPLQGLRKLAPERPKEPEPPVPPPKGVHTRNLEQESPRKYVENEVTIHYKTPVRQEIKEYLSEDELAYRQAEAMKKIYQEERRKKYLQELQDINSRRHTDNFIPSQKSPISLNRYDDFDDLAPAVKPRPRSPEPRLVARALYNFVGQTARELTFRKGDLIYVRRQVDKNWYEGELNAMVGLFPTNYVEIVPYDGIKTTPRKSHEGQARAKYNFLAQTHLELSLAKGELVVITHRVDDNWFEGKIGGRKGIFPASYVDVLIDPHGPPPTQISKPVAAPAAHSLLLNGSAGGKESMGSHCYTPSLPSQQVTGGKEPMSSHSYTPILPHQQLASSYPQQQSKQLNNNMATASGSSYGSLQKKPRLPLEALHIETQSDPVPYKALYKYTPQNDDELELLEGDTVYVLEKCDDGWYVGSSNRTGAFGTFPGNYVEKI